MTQYSNHVYEGIVLDFKRPVYERRVGGGNLALEKTLHLAEAASVTRYF